MLEDELLGSADEIRRKLGMVVREVAYPYGDVNGDVVAAARRHFVRGYTTHLQPLAREDDPLQLPRLDMYYLRGPAGSSRGAAPGSGSGSGSGRRRAGYARRCRGRREDGDVSEPMLSVVMPVRNGLKVLPQSLTALEESDLPRDLWELIVVDDASTDETPELAARWADVVVRLPDSPHGPGYAGIAAWRWPARRWWCSWTPTS